MMINPKQKPLFSKIEMYFFGAFICFSIVLGIFLLLQYQFDWQNSQMIGSFFLFFPIGLLLSYVRNLYLQEKGRSYFLDKIFAAAPSIVFLYDWKQKSGTIISGDLLNLGYSSQDVVRIGNNIFQILVPEEEWGHVNATFQKTIENKDTNSSYKCEWKLKAKDGSIKFFHVTQTIFNQDEESDFILGFAEDITHLKEVEKQVEIDHSRMLEMEKYAALRDLGAGVAHEINNPLAIILGRAQALRIRIDRGSATPQDIGDAVEKIETNVKRISKIVNALRLMTKDGAHEVPENIALSTVFEDIETLWGQRLKNHGFDFTLEKPDPTVNIYVRRSQVVSALFNLITNSFEALSNNETKWIKFESKIKNNFVEISITDSGNGIPTKIKSRIFDPFFTTQNGKGSGLGLTIAKGVAETHHGFLEIDENSPNTKFIFKIPYSSEPKEIAA